MSEYDDFSISELADGIDDIPRVRELVRRIAELEAENERLKACGDALLRRYTGLVDSGDAGFWDWHVEKECIDWMAERSTT